MKRIFIAIAVIALTTTANAQKAYEKGTNSIKAWVGFSPTLTAGGSGFGFSTNNSTPLALSYELGVSDRLSVGAYVGTASSSFVDQDGDGFKNTYLVFGARGSYHFATSDKFDPYVGLMIAYNNVKVSTLGSGAGMFGTAAVSGILPGGYLGANYYFTDNIGLNAEVGYGVSLVSLGVSFKF
ncbi:MAG: OmpW family outer membrane protein [Chitinophagaceae bacterium]|jgi:outer membrane protein W